jgi:hypothetical protein
MALAITIGTGYFFIPERGVSVESAEKSNTYVESSFGFSFEYSSRYNVSRELKNPDADEVLIITSDLKKLKIVDACRGEYDIQIKRTGIPFDQLERDAKSKYDYISDLAIESMIIDGHRAFRVRGTNKIGTDSTGQHIKDYPEDITLFDNGKSYIVLYPCSDEYYNSNEVGKMISSFRFEK